MIKATILQPSVKSLYIEMHVNGKKLASGTGFVVETPSGKAVLVTNRHNVTGRSNHTNEILSPTGAVPDEIAILHNSTTGLGRWISKLEPLEDNNNIPFWVEHPTHGSKVDFVGLPLTKMDNVKLYPYTLGVGDPQIQVHPSDVVSIIGFPFGKSGGGGLAIWSTGFMATEFGVDFEGLPKFLVDCRARQGQSGSAVVAHRNGGTVQLEGGRTVTSGQSLTRFLGIYSGRINEQSDLGIVWKAGAIKELVDSIA
jgi:hypothetical protein